jgi:hypothetical protein
MYLPPDVTPFFIQGNVSRCTKRRDNAHKIEELEVLYPWPPWFGRVVHIHEVIDQRAGGVVHCSPDGDASGRWLELPQWMFDRAACLAIRMAASPHVDTAALIALKTCLDCGAHSLEDVSCGCVGCWLVRRPSIECLCFWCREELLQPATSSVSVTSSPSLASLPPQHGQAGAGITTRSRGRCAGKGARTGFLRVKLGTTVPSSPDLALTASSSSVALASKLAPLRSADCPKRSRFNLAMTSFRCATMASAPEARAFACWRAERSATSAVLSASIASGRMSDVIGTNSIQP